MTVHIPNSFVFFLFDFASSQANNPYSISPVLIQKRFGNSGWASSGNSSADGQRLFLVGHLLRLRVRCLISLPLHHEVSLSFRPNDSFAALVSARVCPLNPIQIRSCQTRSEHVLGIFAAACNNGYPAVAVTGKRGVGVLRLFGNLWRRHFVTRGGWKNCHRRSPPRQ